MTAIIFAGPSIQGIEFPGDAKLVVREPVRQGDVYRAALSRPTAIGLIDGYFADVPAVWHKEILWALTRGIQVYGSSSMGALRAAELDQFGMIGVGKIYEWYRDGDIEDDDEVALVHGPADAGYISLTEPMVNIRATCQRALESGIINRELADATIGIAKGLHYRERSWDAILSIAEQSTADLYHDFVGWVASNKVDQKRSDAQALLAAMTVGDASGNASRTFGFVDFKFSRTHLWEAGVRRWKERETSTTVHSRLSIEVILRKLRDNPDLNQSIRRRALLRAALLVEATAQGVDVSLSDRRRAIDQFRRGHCLFRKSDLDGWLVRNELTIDEFHQLMDEEVRIRIVSQLLEAQTADQICSVLRLNDTFSKLLQNERSDITP